MPKKSKNSSNGRHIKWFKSKSRSQTEEQSSTDKSNKGSKFKTGLNSCLTVNKITEAADAKNKKENVNKKEEEPVETQSASGDILSKDFASKLTVNASEMAPAMTSNDIWQKNGASFDPEPPKIHNTVRFNTEVRVVHFLNDEVINHTVEPLKKELEQQERNKEMRKQFMPENGDGLKRSMKRLTNDYMSEWY